MSDTEQRLARLEQAVARIASEVAKLVEKTHVLEGRDLVFIGETMGRLKLIAEELGKKPTQVAS